MRRNAQEPDARAARDHGRCGRPTSLIVARARGMTSGRFADGRLQPATSKKGSMCSSMGAAKSEM